MTIQTIQRAFNRSSNLIAAAKEKSNSFVYGIKKFFYNIFSLGGAKAMDKARSEGREKEVVYVAFDVLKNLPDNYEELNSSEFKDKILYTDFEKKYQIVQEGTQLCVYSGNVELTLRKQQHFDKDTNSRIILKQFRDQGDVRQLITELSKVESNDIYKKLKSSDPEHSAATAIQKTLRGHAVRRDIYYTKVKDTLIDKYTKARSLTDIDTINAGFQLDLDKITRYYPSLFNTVSEVCTRCFDELSLYESTRDAISKATTINEIKQVKVDKVAERFKPEIEGIKNAKIKSIEEYYNQCISYLIGEAKIAKKVDDLNDIYNNNNDMLDTLKVDSPSLWSTIQEFCNRCFEELGLYESTRDAISKATTISEIGQITLNNVAERFQSEVETLKNAKMKSIEEDYSQRISYLANRAESVQNIDDLNAIYNNNESWLAVLSVDSPSHWSTIQEFCNRCFEELSLYESTRDAISKAETISEIGQITLNNVAERFQSEIDILKNNQTKLINENYSQFIGYLTDGYESARSVDDLNLIFSENKEWRDRFILDYPSSNTINETYTRCSAELSAYEFMRDDISKAETITKVNKVNVDNVADRFKQDIDTLKNAKIKSIEESTFKPDGLFNFLISDESIGKLYGSNYQSIVSILRAIQLGMLGGITSKLDVRGMSLREYLTEGNRLEEMRTYLTDERIEKEFPNAELYPGYKIAPKI